MVVDRFHDASSKQRTDLCPLPVLVVDDHPANRWVLGKLLQRLGIECRFASDGTEAIAVAGMRRWGAFLMDIEMRRLDGDQAARQLRKLSPYLADVPIIAVTSLPAPLAVKRCRRAGIDGMITKPVSIRILEDQLRAHAGHLFADEPPVKRLGNISRPFRIGVHSERRLTKPPQRPSTSR